MFAVLSKLQWWQQCTANNAKSWPDPKQIFFNSPLHNTLVGPYTAILWHSHRAAVGAQLLPPFTSLSVSTLSSYDSHTAAVGAPPPPTPFYLPGTLVSTLTSYDSHTAAATNPSDLILPSWHIMSVSALTSIQLTIHATVLQQAPPPPHTHTHTLVCLCTAIHKQYMPQCYNRHSTHTCPSLHYLLTYSDVASTLLIPLISLALVSCLSMHFHLYTQSHSHSVTVM